MKKVRVKASKVMKSKRGRLYRRGRHVRTVKRGFMPWQLGPKYMKEQARQMRSERADNIREMNEWFMRTGRPILIGHGRDSRAIVQKGTLRRERRNYGMGYLENPKERDKIINNALDLKTKFLGEIDKLSNQQMTGVQQFNAAIEVATAKGMDRGYDKALKDLNLLKDGKIKERYGKPEARKNYGMGLFESPKERKEISDHLKVLRHRAYSKSWQIPPAKLHSEQLHEEAGFHKGIARGYGAALRDLGLADDISPHIKHRYGNPERRR